MNKTMIKCTVAILMATLLVLPSACKRAPAFEVSSFLVTPPEVLALPLEPI